MRIVLEIPDYVERVDIYSRTNYGAHLTETIIDKGILIGGSYVNKEETMGTRYSEGLEKRIDVIENALSEIKEQFAKTDESIESVCNSTDMAFDGVRKERDALNARMSALDDAICCLRERMDELENRLAKPEKPCIDAKAFDKALDIPKVKPVPDSALENRGPYTDILRRLKELEEEVKISPTTFSRYKYNEERLTDVIGNCVNNDERIEAIEKLLDKGEDGAYPFLPTFKDYAEIEGRVDALEKGAKTSRPTWDNFSLHDQRICALEERAKTSRPGWSNYNVLLHRIEELEKLPKRVDALTEEVKISPSTYSSLKLVDNRLEDVEKKAVVAEGVRKQLAEDIKAIQGRINKICEETCVDA